ncbi:NUDIX hydrolase [Actinomycetaceae bacterium WB03_NA08]|uniref:NUDIX hydrolase n=1 Tax=Scrofimicrobium canadense TaxID=2652290 RepID=A0A6N7VQD1_9ACTO|nr:NUDIX hydrolase [Scrofimicrobium canadense]MSS83954.1 NUDIX hydrolase [Scrofimicrobium canadense]
MMRDEHNDDAIVVDSQRRWAGRLWSMQEDRLLLSAHSNPITRQYMRHPGAVAILALNDANEVLLINQYRHPVRAQLWEIPAGLLDIEGEDYLSAAKRELREEVDLYADQWNVLLDLFLSPGCSTESLRIFLARDLHAAESVFLRQDEEADIAVKWVPVDEAVAYVLAGNFHNPSLVSGILALESSMRRSFHDIRPSDAPWFR